MATPNADTKIEVTLGPRAQRSGFERESLWAISLGNSLFELASIPAYAYNLNLRDVVTCEASGSDLPLITGVHTRSGRNTLRLFLSHGVPDALVTRIVHVLRERGALAERAGPGHISFSLPCLADLDWACEFISREDPSELIAYEAGFCSSEPFYDPTLPIDPADVA